MTVSQTVVADLRISKVRVSASVRAPQEGGAQRRISWLLRQLADAPDDTLVDVHYAGAAQDTCERLGDVRESPAALVSERSGDVTSFDITAVAPLGTKRSGLKGAFIPSVIGATEAFYSSVLQPVRAWVPPAPKLASAGWGMSAERWWRRARPSNLAVGHWVAACDFGSRPAAMRRPRA